MPPSMQCRSLLRSYNCKIPFQTLDAVWLIHTRVLQLLRTSFNSDHRSELPKLCTSLFSTSGRSQAKAKAQRRRRFDPYREAQARQRRAAHLARKDVLRQERAEAIGDPVRSRPTPFIASLKKGTPAPLQHVPPKPTSDPDLSAPLDATSEAGLSPTTNAILTEKVNHQTSPLNFFLTPAEFEESVQYSKALTKPLPGRENALVDPLSTQRRSRGHDDDHMNAERALARIAALDNGNSKDKTRNNIQRCISEFGRHQTDSTLPPPLTSTTPVVRAGPDTGSSEVQVAILTTKINILADQMDVVGHKDKHNKRNLRLLVHRRQKLLAYLRRRERGGPRWQNLMDKLGLGDASWKGEISL